MKVIKFSINEDYYNALKSICEQEELTIKRKINILLAQDRETTDFKSAFPEDFNEKRKSVTLKINEELYKGIMKNCGKYDVSSKRYVPYLIYKFLKGKM